MRGNKRWLIVITLVGLGVVAAYVVLHNRYEKSLSACISLLSGDPHRGGQLFQSRGCNACHPLFGQGPKIAADFATRTPGGWRPMRTVAAMWSHGPDIWNKLKDARMGYPRISEEDVVDLFAFMASLQYMDPPGDASRGGILFQTKHCEHCHGLTQSEDKVGPALVDFRDNTPILWAQRMWNHSGAMLEAVQSEGIEWPMLSGDDVADLLVYIQRASGNSLRTEGSLWPADADAGERLFSEKGCVECHTVRGTGGDTGPVLDAPSEGVHSLAELASMMWNHAPDMIRETEVRGMTWPELEGEQMADLIAYLYEVRYLEPQGDPNLGKQIFASKGCAQCHAPNVEGKQVGPELRGADRSYCMTKMAFLMWSHGPKMYDQMQEAGMLWKPFSEEEMTHLVAYLNTE